MTSKALAITAHLGVSACILGACAGSPSAPPAPPPANAAPIRATATEAPPPPPAEIGPWQVIGTSVQGRPIRLREVGHGPRRVLFVGGIHGNESEGAYTTDQLPVAFIAAGLADDVTLSVIEDVNPDGRAAGTRGNANGVDVNRNFPATNFDVTNPSFGGTPLSQPESRVLHDAIERIDPALVLVAHSWIGKEFVNFDGPAADIAKRFSEASGLPVEASTAFAPTPGSLGSYVGRDRGKPILTIEVLHGSDPRADWDRLRDALLQAIQGTA